MRLHLHQPSVRQAVPRTGAVRLALRARLYWQGRCQQQAPPRHQIHQTAAQEQTSQQGLALCCWLERRTAERQAQASQPPQRYLLAPQTTTKQA